MADREGLLRRIVSILPPLMIDESCSKDEGCVSS
jgi:hypothetical protein